MPCSRRTAALVALLAPFLSAGLVTRGADSSGQALIAATARDADVLHAPQDGAEQPRSLPERHPELLDLVMLAQGSTVVHSGQRLQGAAQSERVQGKFAQLRWMVQCGASAVGKGAEGKSTGNATTL